MIDSTARGHWRDLEARLRPFIARRVRSPADVDDVVQDVFLRMQRGLADLREDERFGAWVYKVARSAIADHQRARARHPLQAQAATVDDAGAETGEEDAEARRALLSCLAPFIARLPPMYREALTLAELEGLNQRDAADMLGTSLTAMKSRVQRGRAHLRTELEGCCEIALDARGAPISCVPRSRNGTGCDCK